MTTPNFYSTQLKATLLGSLRARGGHPDPAKLPKGNFDLHRVEIKEKKRESKTHRGCARKI